MRTENDPFPPHLLPVLTEAERAANEKRKQVQELQERLGRLERLVPPITNLDQHRLIHGELEPSKPREVVEKWFRAWECGDDNEHPWLVLCGPPGTGKTVASIELALTSRHSSYVGARKLEQVFSARFGSAIETQEELRTCRTLLVVDDLGREHDSDLVGATLLDLLDARRCGTRLTIAVTNLTREQFSARYPDDRLASRLAQSARWAACVGTDMRRAR